MVCRFRRTGGDPPGPPDIRGRLGVQTAVLIAVAAFAALVSGITGFGYGIVAMSTLPLFLGLRVLNPAVTAVSCGTSAYVLVSGWRHVRWRPLIPLLAGAAAGIPIGVTALGRLDEHAARRVLGVVLALYVLYDVLPLPRLRRRLSPAWGAAFGLLSGALGGAFAMGGPPVVVFFTLRGMRKEEMRPSLSAYFVMTSLYKIPILFLNGFLTAEVGRVVLLMLVPTAAGVAAGQFLAKRISHLAFRRALTAFLAAIAVLYLAGG